MKHKVEISLNEFGFGKINLGGSEVQDVRSFKVDHIAGEIPHVSISVFVNEQKFIFETADVDIDLILKSYISDSALENFLETIQAEVHRRGLLKP